MICIVAWLYYIVLYIYCAIIYKFILFPKLYSPKIPWHRILDPLCPHEMLIVLIFLMILEWACIIIGLLG